MDPNQGGGTPTQDQPATPSPAVDEKCSTCSNQASGGNCVPCGQPQMSCACPPVSPSAPVSEAGGGQQGGSPAPAV